MANENPTLFALLVGIDQYRYPVRPLGGCLSDVAKMEAYLQAEADKKEGGFEKVDIKKLENSQATKAAIVDALQTHLGQAQEGDVALFYFSGHGAQEAADPAIWRFEPDGKLEGLVCYDSILEEEIRTLLADKELRYLLHRVAHQMPDGSAKGESPHIVTIFDCCHSGENTRNGAIPEERKGAQERRYVPLPPSPDAVARMGAILPQREWSDFIFADQKGITPDDLQTKPLGEVIPQAKHVQLAACRSDESAYEMNGDGVFTKNLIEVLSRSQGAVTYYNLRSRLKNYIKNQFRQTPQIYEPGGNEDIYRTFLHKELTSKPLGGIISFNLVEGWTMDMGAIHGVSSQAKMIKVVSADGQMTLEAGIGKVHSSWTKVLFSEDQLSQLDKGLTYYGHVEEFLSAPIHVYISNNDQNKKAHKQLKDLIESQGKNLFFTAEEASADYTVQMSYGRYVITLPEDPFRPLVLPTPDYSRIAALETMQYLHHISQWEYVWRLENEGGNQLSHNAVKVEFYQVSRGADGKTTEKLLSLEEGKENTILAEFEQKEPEDEAIIRVKIINQSPHPIYISFLYLSMNFGVYSEWLANKVQRLEAAERGKEPPAAWVFEDGLGMEFHPEMMTETFNWKEDVSRFKIIASREEFDVLPLDMDALPDPSELAQSTRGSETRGPRVKSRADENADADAWMTLSYTVRLPNLKYNRISEARLAQLLETGAAEFVYHLYLEEASPFGGNAQLKEGISWIEDEETKGLFFKVKMNSANWVSRQIRRRRYKKKIKENPTLVRIVSEGDSWFQYPHPKVLDVIDHLFEHYAIYSLGAAGDTLRNYFQKGEYKKALTKEQPKILLLSGGGNDILGDQIKQFMASDIPADATDPQQFLKDSFFQEIKSLQAIYREVFESVQSDFPGVQIICHGYDYIIPNPKKGWFAQNVKDKVPDAQHQKVLADFLIDHFNEALAEIAQNYDHVHYLDLRKSVRDDLWYDEIHPNSQGFQDVTLRFHEKIREIVG